MKMLCIYAVFEKREVLTSMNYDLEKIGYLGYGKQRINNRWECSVAVDNILSESHGVIGCQM